MVDSNDSGSDGAGGNASSQSPVAAPLSLIARGARAIRDVFSRLHWKDVARFFNSGFTIIPSIGFIGVLLLQIGSQMLDQSVAIVPISVPRSLADDGYTPGVVAQKLNDAVTALMDRASTSMKREKISIASGTEDVIAPNSGDTLAAFVSKALYFLRLSRRTYVTGEITKRGEQLWLTLRMGGQQTAFRAIGPKNSPEELFADAAREILWRTAPFFVASADYSQLVASHAAALAEANSIIWSHQWDSDSLDPDNRARAWGLRGLVLQEQHDFRGANSSFLASLAVDSNLFETHNNYGSLLLDMKRFEDAAAQERLAIGINPDFAKSHYNLGMAYFDEGRLGEAIIQFRIAIRLDGSFAFSHTGMGLVYARQRKFFDALKEFRLAVALYPKSPEILYNLAHALVDTGQTAEGIGEYRLALKFDPADADAYFNLADIHERQGDFSGAESEFRSAISNNPTDSEAHFRLGRVLVRQDRPGEAIPELRQAIDLDSKNADAHAVLGIALRKTILDPSNRQTAEQISRAACLEFNAFQLLRPTSSLIQDAIEPCRTTYPKLMTAPPKPSRVP